MATRRTIPLVVLVSRGVVVRAFEQLHAEGYVAAKVGSGTVVRRLPDRLFLSPSPGTPPPPGAEPNDGSRARNFSLLGTMAVEPDRYDQGPLRAFRANRPALDLTARLFVDPGDRVGVEDPGYPGAAQIFRSWGAQVCPLAVDHEGLDPFGNVVFAGSFSKVLFPSLRLGYLVVPPDLVDRYAAVHSLTQRHAPLVDQAVVADFMDQGHFGRHLRAMREVYAERLGVLTREVKARLAGRLDLSPVEAGLQTSAWLAGGDAEALAAAAALRRVEVTPLGRFGAGVPPGFLLGFAAFDAAEIRRGVEELAFVLDQLDRNQGQKKAAPEGR